MTISFAARIKATAPATRSFTLDSPPGHSSASNRSATHRADEPGLSLEPAMSAGRKTRHLDRIRNIARTFESPIGPPSAFAPDMHRHVAVAGNNSFMILKNLSADDSVDPGESLSRRV